MSGGNQKNTAGSSFSLRRFLLQSARIFRDNNNISSNSNSNCNISSSQINQSKSYDLEKGASTSTVKIKHDKKSLVSVESGNKINISDSSIAQRNSTLPLTSSTYNLNDAPQNAPSSSSGSLSKMTTPKYSDSVGQLICPICYTNSPSLPNAFYFLSTCKHSACEDCLNIYLRNEIKEFRTEIACPQCSETMHPSDIAQLLKDQPEFIKKYEEFMVRKFLLSDPDSRWCPAQDCSFAVIASGCASCPRIRCQHPECGVSFCYHCKAEWHPDQTCDAARSSRKIPAENLSRHLKNRDDIKPCPKCQILIVKMDDGSCNHMVCSICGAEFCWLCMKEITDLHYLSPSGCTFWGKKPWSRKKKLMWQIGTLIGAPVGIALIAGITVPAMIIGIPVWVGKKIYARYHSTTKSKRNFAVFTGVVGSLLISPILAGLAVAIGVPILLFYVYGVVPVSLCRASCETTNNQDDEEEMEFVIDETIADSSNNRRQNIDGSSVDTISRSGAISIGEVSLSAGSGSQIGVAGSNAGAGTSVSNIKYDRESTSGLAGSILGGHRLELLGSSDDSSLEYAVDALADSNISNDTASIRTLNGYVY